MNNDVYESLTDEQKAAVEEANVECTKASRIGAEDAETEYVQLLKDVGMEIYEPTTEELQLFSDAASKSWRKAEEVMGTERYNALLETVHK